MFTSLSKSTHFSIVYIGFVLDKAGPSFETNHPHCHQNAILLRESGRLDREGMGDVLQARQWTSEKCPKRQGEKSDDENRSIFHDPPVKGCLCSQGHRSYSRSWQKCQTKEQKWPLEKEDCNSVQLVIRDDFYILYCYSHGSTKITKWGESGSCYNQKHALQ